MAKKVISCKNKYPPHIEAGLISTCEYDSCENIQHSLMGLMGIVPQKKFIYVYEPTTHLS